MKILYLSNPIASSFGGAERMLDQLTSAMPEDEHVFLGTSAALLVLFRRKGYQAHASRGGFEPVSLRNVLLFPVSVVLGFAQVLRYRRLFRDAGVLVAPTSFSEPFFVFPWARLFFRTPTVFMFRNAAFPKAIARTPLLGILNRSLRRSRVLMISPEQRASFAALGLDVSTARTIENGVPIREMRPEDPRSRRDGGATGVIRLGFLGRLAHEKGLDILLDALRQVQVPAGRRIELAIGGEGPDAGSCRAALSARPLPAGITLEWRGFVSDSAAFYRGIDLLVFPTRREAFGLVLIEAWERGVPVLSSDVPVLTRLKASCPAAAERALVFRSEDPEDLARKIEMFIAAPDVYTDPVHRRQLHEFVAREYALGPCVEKYRELYRVP